MLNTTKGQSLYRKAKKIIPGGTQLLSKRPEMYLPEAWPAYYSKCKGAEVWGWGTAYASKQAGQPPVAGVKS